MLKTALFDCAINEKCCSVDGGRGICPFFSSPPGGFDSSRVPTPGNLPSKAKKMLMPGVSPGGGGGWAQVELTDALWRQRDNHKETTMPCMQVASKHLSARHFYTIILPG